MNPCLRHRVLLRSPRPTARIHSLPGASPPGPPLSALLGLQTSGQPVHRPSYTLVLYTVTIYMALRYPYYHAIYCLVRGFQNNFTVWFTVSYILQPIFTSNDSIFDLKLKLLNFLLNAIFALSLIWYGIRSSHNCQHSIAIWPYTVYC